MLTFFRLFVARMRLAAANSLGLYWRSEASSSEISWMYCAKKKI
jgi:hypothetical protein